MPQSSQKKYSNFWETDLFACYILFSAILSQLPVCLTGLDTKDLDEDYKKSRGKWNKIRRILEVTVNTNNGSLLKCKLETREC